MRQGQQHQQKRMRGRNNNNNRKGPNQLNRSYESNGPDVKIRGTASHIADKYVQLARDAQSSGDPVSAENYLQHAEHYYRIVAASQPQYPQNQGGQGFQRADDESRDEDSYEDAEGAQANSFDGQQQERPQQQGYPQNAPQPYEGGQQPPREHQPRENRPYNGNDTGLPAFITGGQDNQGGEGRNDREGYGRNRRNRRFGRYGRNGGPGDGAPEGGAPGAEPEVAPGE